MCGLSGFIGMRAVPRGEAQATVRAMALAIAHRGPDDTGEWVDEEAGVAMGHRRLSILDLSEAGHQPMVSPSGQFVLILNGEIYNFKELRASLNRVSWRGHSDTEVLLAAVEAWGLVEALRRSVGMFALALWDRQSRVLSLARDRMGEKPLYYGVHSGTFLFGSQLNALRPHPAFKGVIDREALAHLFRFGYIPAPHAIYEGIHKLLPGTILDVSDGGTVVAAPRPYWSLAEVHAAAAAQPFRGSSPEAVDELERLMRAAVAGQQIGDVPLGAFLSGGWIHPPLSRSCRQEVIGLCAPSTVGFEARATMKVGTREPWRATWGRTTRSCDLPSRSFETIPRMPAVYDEPFGDASQIPTYLVAELARRHVTVALSGDGGDELGGGYPHYTKLPRLWRFGAVFPGVARRAVGGVGRIVPPGWVNGGAGALLALRGRAPSIPPSERFREACAALAAGDDVDFYETLTAQWRVPEEVVRLAVRGGVRPEIPASIGSSAERLMFVDAARYLPDDILVKVDRAAMAVSLETRAPLLDHRVVEFLARVPLGLKIRHGCGKWLLRQVLHRYVPPALVDRPKMGFSVPADRWLREGRVRDWADDLLAEDRLLREGFLEPAPIRKRWAQHRSGQYNWQSSLWVVLMFQAWLEEQHRVPETRLGQVA
jgi:asparagine synthase (glutamine-hydrolysing)